MCSLAFPLRECGCVTFGLSLSALIHPAAPPVRGQIMRMGAARVADLMCASPPPVLVKPESGLGRRVCIASRGGLSLRVVSAFRPGERQSKPTEPLLRHFGCALADPDVVRRLCLGRRISTCWRPVRETG